MGDKIGGLRWDVGEGLECTEDDCRIRCGIGGLGLIAGLRYLSPRYSDCRMGDLCSYRYILKIF